MFFLKLLFFTLCLANTIWAQSTFNLIDSVQLPLGAYSNFKINPKGELLIVLNGTNLLKIDQDKKILLYPNKKNISQLDGNTSLKTSLVYNYQELQILNDHLNPIQDGINLNEHGIYASSIATIDSQLLWYFDPIEQRLVQWNYQLKTIVSKSNILFFKEGDTTINEIYMYKNRLFLKSQCWLYEYDYFGNFKAEIPIKSGQYSFFNKENFYQSDGSNLIEINLINHKISLTDNFFYGKDFIMDKDQLFVIKDNVMYIYTRIKN